MNGMWGYKITDLEYKSTRTLIRYLVRAAGRNANLLLNIGPQPNGELPAEALDRLREMGEWLRRYGETIYGTRGGIVAPHQWGVTTIKGTNYMSISSILTTTVSICPRASAACVRHDCSTTARMSASRARSRGVLLRLGKVPDTIDHIVELTLE